jgi:hypothetical protein
MQIDMNDHKAVNAWVRKAKEEGWKRPREIVEAAELLDYDLQSSFGYCDGCTRAVADFDVLDTAGGTLVDDNRYQSRLEAPHDGLTDDEKIICVRCLGEKA